MKLVAKTLFLAGICWFAIGHAGAQESPVIMKNEHASVTLADLHAELASLPQARREQAYSKVENLRAVAENLLVWRSLSHKAEQEGILGEEAFQRRAQLAREKAIGSVYLERAEGNADMQAALNMARAEYRANPDSFTRKEQVEASHILIALRERNEEDALALAKEILQRLRDGEDFAALARKYSDDPGSGARGGNLGLFGRDRMVKPFEEAVFAMKEAGQLSEPVRSQFGYHIIRLDARHDAVLLPFEQISDQLARNLAQRVLNDRRQAVVDPLRDPETVTVDMEALEALVQIP